MAITTAAGSNYLQLATASTWIQTGRPFTVMAWVNLSAATTSFSCVCSSYDGTTNSWEFGARTSSGNQGWYFTWSTGGTFFGDVLNLAPVLAANQWYHLCVRYGMDGSAAKVYDQVQDGILVGTSAAQTTAIAAGARKLRIHHSADNATAGFPGRTEFIRMFEGCLTLSEINACRLSATVPRRLMSRVIADVPTLTLGGASTWAYDRGPLALGPLTVTGTVAYAADPPGVAAAADEPPLNRYWLTGVPAGAAGGGPFPFFTARAGGMIEMSGGFRG